MNLSSVLPAMLVHLQITFFGVLLACVIGFPIAGFLIGRPRLSHAVFSVVDAIQTVPTIAMMTFVMLVFGLSDTTVIVTIVLYALFPIIRNTYVGLDSVDRGTIRAGRGIGMTRLQIFRLVRFPIAIPLILTGVRLAIITALGIATTGVFIGAGGLGMLIWRGIQTRNWLMLLSGAVPVSMLALIFEYALGYFEKRMTQRSKQLVATK